MRLHSGSFWARVRGGPPRTVFRSIREVFGVDAGAYARSLSDVWTTVKTPGKSRALLYFAGARYGEGVVMWMSFNPSPFLSVSLHEHNLRLERIGLCRRSTFITPELGATDFSQVGFLSIPPTSISRDAVRHQDADEAGEPVPALDSLRVLPPRAGQPQHSGHAVCER